jgi:hypothetical protein
MTAISSSSSRPAALNPVQSFGNSLAEERREVFESVLAALAGDPLDADQLAAGGRLLKHLSRTTEPPSHGLKLL